MVGDHALHALIDTYAELGREVATDLKTSDGLRAVPAVAARAVPGVDAASITRGRSDTGWKTVGGTNALARQADAMQYELGSGPCVDALEKDHVFRSADLSTDERWPDYGRLVAKSLGLHSVLSIRLGLDEDNVMTGLNLYSRQRDGFDEQACNVAMLLATHATAVVSRVRAREKTQNLEIALESSREIGTAIGVLMNTHKITSDDAFDLMRIASQHSHRKLRDIAADVVETGAIDVGRTGGGLAAG
jgi:GAF domain-containing protein